MGSRTFGADADELDRLSAAFRLAADELDADGRQLTQLLTNVAWLGGVAGRFTAEWTGVRAPQIELSTRFLREAADFLAHSASQQRQASGEAGGSLSATWLQPRSGPPPEHDGGAWDSLEDALIEIGLARGAVKAVIEGLTEFLGPDQVRELLDNLLTPGLVTAFKALNGVLDLADALIGMAQDFAAHPQLPMDERLVHAVTDATITFALAKGVDAAITWGLTALGSVVPVLGTGVGFVAGKVIGFALGEAVEWVVGRADEAWDVKDEAADLVVAGYRQQQRIVGDLEDAVGGAADIVAGVGDVIVGGAGEVVDAVGDTGEAVVDGARRIVGGLF